ncbi:MAG: hypothetical protein KGS09_17825 [Nitrospirae bacterium]|nr:hypothetical protein [Nitrospirota bacterium]
MASLRARLAAIPMDRLILFLDFDDVDAHHAAPESGQADPVGARYVGGTCSPAVGRGHQRTSPESLRRRIGLHKVCYVGHHGSSCLEADGNVRWLVAPPRKTLVRRWLQALQTAAYGIEGAFVEDKDFPVALHDLLVKPKHRSRLRRRALRSFAPWIAHGFVSLLRGKRVLEARSSKAWNKGTAVSMLLQRPRTLHRVLSISATIKRISMHSPWCMAEDLPFESACGVGWKCGMKRRFSWTGAVILWCARQDLHLYPSDQ